jgi:Glycoside Hydrolase Family 113
MTARALRCATAVLAAVLAPVPSSATARPPGPCEHLPIGWVRGFDFTSWEPDGYAGEPAGRSFDRLLATGANAVALVATQYQASATSDAVAADPRRSPSDDALRAAAARAHAGGLRVRLRVVVDRDDGGARAAIAPADPDAWFASYGARVRHYAELADALGVEELDIGAELGGVTTEANAGRWRALVAAVRSVFHGRVSYSANWDEYEHVSWWDALDEIAIDAYFPLATAPAPPEDAVVAAWSSFVDAGGATHRWLDEIGAAAAAFDRPVVFTELGYSSATGALVAPWRTGGVYSADEQDTGLVAAFRALAGRPWFEGVYLWQWSADPSAGGPGDTDHTVQGKPAEDTVGAWFRAAGPGRCVETPQSEANGSAAR